MASKFYLKLGDWMKLLEELIFKKNKRSLGIEVWDSVILGD